VRFPDRLRVEIEATSDARRALIPHLILQPLVENAVRHGIAPLEAGGAVVVEAARQDEILRVVVRDNGVGLPQADTGAGIGLRGVRARLAQLYGADHRFHLGPGLPNGTIACIEIPYRVAEP
jgi:LytS/YehU family sensor histidine kinase